MKRYRKYKESGVQWIGEIPEHYKVVPLSLLARENKKKNHEENENILSLSYGRIIKRDLSRNFGLLPEKFDHYQVVENGYIIIRSTDLQNDKKSLRVGLVTEYGVITSAYLCLSPQEKTDSKYLFYYLNMCDLKKVFYSLGSGVRQSLRFEEFKSFPVIVPNFVEQKQISSYLDKKTQKLGSLIQKLEKKMVLLKEQRQAFISHYVTKGLNPQMKMKDSGVEWIGEIPEHYKVVPLSLLARENKKKNHGENENILSLSYGRIIKRDLSRNFGLLPEKFDHYQVVENGYIIIRSTDLHNDKKSLRVGLVTEYGVITSAYLCLSPQEKTDSKYLFYYLNMCDLKKVFYSLGSGVRQSLRFEEFRSFPVIVPNFVEQKQISSYLDKKTQHLDTLVQKIQKKIILLKEYRQSLISAVVSGQINVCKDDL